MKILFFLLGGILITNTYQFYILFIGSKNISLTYILLIVGFLLLLFKQIKEKKHTVIFSLIKNDLILRYFLVFLVFLLISVIYSADKVDGLKICTMVSFGFMSYYLFSNVKLNIRKCVWVFVISTLPMAILMLFFSFNEPLKMKFLSLSITRLFIEPDTLKGVLRGYGPEMNNITYLYRQGGFFVNTSVGGLYLGLNIAILFALYVSEKNLWLKIVNQILIIVFVVALATTQSIGAIGAVLIAIFIATVLILFRDFRLWKRLLLLYMVFILTLCLCVKFNPSAKISMQKLIGIRKYDALHSMYFRKQIWQASWEVTKKNWVKGVGLSAKSWEIKYNPDAKKIGAPLNMPPHNMYLYVWGHSGILALGSFLLLLYTLFSNSIKSFIKYSQSYENLFAISTLMSVLILFLVGMTENFLLAEPRISISFWAIIGLVTNMLKNRSDEK